MGSSMWPGDGHGLPCAVCTGGALMCGLVCAELCARACASEFESAALTRTSTKWLLMEVCSQRFFHAELALKHLRDSTHFMDSASPLISG